MMRARLVDLLALAALAFGLGAQGGPVQTEVRVTVTAAAGKDVFLDRGREAGIEPGDEVTLSPSGGGSVLGRIRSVSRSNARAELVGVVRRITPGTRGTVRVPSARVSGTTPTATSRERAVPEHPPWQQPFGKDDAGKPLLAPVSGRTPAERPFRLRGRTWLNYTNSWNRVPVNQRYSLGSVGADFTASNPLGEGGELHFRGDVSDRRSELSGAVDDVTTRVRLDRLSYRLGHAAGARRRVQAGRFLQTMFPELGLVDGVEADTEFRPGQRVGFSFGGFPEPYTSQATGDDLQGALFWRYTAGADDSFDVGAAYQKTWHEGSVDRDLLLINTSFRPIEGLRVYSSTWVDYYTGSEQVESSGLEITEFLLNGSYRVSPGSGVGLSVSHFRWPDLKRNEFRAGSAALILDNRVLRASGNSWHQLGENLRLSLLLTYWEDQSSDGKSGEVGLSLRDLFFESSTIDVRGFSNESTYDDGYGVRGTFSQYSGSWSYFVGYEISKYDSGNRTIGGNEFELLHAAVAGLQASLTDSTDFSFNFDYRFGDDQDSITIGAYFQTRY